tara:strand:- start:129 stop:248 length:120 start_codon:yes stop_codon:yes gene_type:complete
MDTHLFRFPMMIIAMDLFHPDLFDEYKIISLVPEGPGTT